MKTYRVEYSQVINAPAEVVHRIISDYHTHHPAILPPQFTKLLVHQGGQGAGSEIEVHMKVMGQTTVMHMHVTEPQPGRTLVETDVNTGTATTFGFEPLADNKSKLTFTTDFAQKSGVGGYLEKLIVQSVTPRIYKEEMQNVNAYAQNMVSVS